MDFHGFSSILGGSGARRFGSLWRPVATCGAGLDPLLETLQPGRQDRQGRQAGQAGQAGRAGRQAGQAGRKASRQAP